jgi:hypothetical protein
MEGIVKKFVLYFGIGLLCLGCESPQSRSPITLSATPQGLPELQEDRSKPREATIAKMEAVKQLVRLDLSMVGICRKESIRPDHPDYHSMAVCEKQIARARSALGYAVWSRRGLLRLPTEPSEVEPLILLVVVDSWDDYHHLTGDADSSEGVAFVATRGMIVYYPTSPAGNVRWEALAMADAFFLAGATLPDAESDPLLFGAACEYLSGKAADTLVLPSDIMGALLFPDGFDALLEHLDRLGKESTEEEIEEIGNPDGKFDRLFSRPRGADRETAVRCLRRAASQLPGASITRA